MRSSPGKNIHRSFISGFRSHVVEPALSYVSRRQICERFMHPFIYSPAILMYHRILPEKEIDADDPNSLLIVSVERFEEQIAYLSEHYHVIAMDKVVSKLTESTLNPYVAITIDDGYRDSLLYAVPILQKYGVPATIYLVTRYLEGDDFVWHLELWNNLRELKGLEISWKGVIYHLPLESLKNKQRCFWQFNELFRSCRSLEEQKELSAHFKAGSRFSSLHPELLSWADVEQLKSNPLISFGSHTHNHLNLRQLTECEVREELTISLDYLTKHLGRNIVHLAFPHGSSNEVGIREAEIAGLLGFQTAVTTKWPKIGQPTNPWMLPRMAVFNRTTRYTLDRRLRGWDGLYRNYLGH
jgi:peptidoglycan/xylan/chitin deacetylase (PgdA/CDA1 family)